MSDENAQPGPRKQRMGQPARPEPVVPVAAESITPAAPTEPAAPKRTRMGAPGQSPLAGPARRMGAAPAAAPTASTEPAAVRTRMGEGAAATARMEMPTATSTAPVAAAEVRQSGPWGKRIVAVAALLVLGVGLVLLARWLRTLPEVQSFLVSYPGHSELPESAPPGLPAWIGWQHFFNMFFMVLIIRTGLQVRYEKKSPGSWQPKADSFFSPKGATPKKVSLTQWVHQSLDVLWMLNGLVFVVLLFVTGQWMKIVPLSWDIIPNALSSALQYASLDWPLENGWIHYNALQVLAYFTTVFIAAPLAALSGVRFSTWWPDKNSKLTKLYPVEIARAIHFPVMIYFVIFIVIHVFLVFFTGALRNLNHMYTSRDLVDGWGLAIFTLSLLVMAAAWWLTQPLFMRPLAARTGTLSK